MTCPARMNSAQNDADVRQPGGARTVLATWGNERLICKNERPISSRIPPNTCQTAGMLEARHRNDVRYRHARRTIRSFESGN